MIRALLAGALLASCKGEPPPRPAPIAVPHDAAPATFHVESNADEATRTVPNAEHPAPPMPSECLQLLAITDTLKSCRGIPEDRRLDMIETIESIPRDLDGADPVIFDAVANSCRLAFERLHERAKECPELFDDKHERIPNVEKTR
jgi:hypothetical protein